MRYGDFLFSFMSQIFENRGAGGANLSNYGNSFHKNPVSLPSHEILASFSLCPGISITT